MEQIEEKTKFCKFCGQKIVEDAVMCTYCGRQVEELKNSQPQVIVNNTNTNSNVNTNTVTSSFKGKPKNKWIALLLCIFTLCGHKFYEGKIGMGIVYLFTAGLFGVGWLIDLISLVFKPNPYYV